MTISKLHKLLGKLIAEGHGRKTVDINKRTFTHPLESDGVCIMPVAAIELKNCSVIDDDGGSKVTSRGVEVTRTSLVLTGGGEDYED